jgi:hypothetical protein
MKYNCFAGTPRPAPIVLPFGVLPFGPLPDATMLPARVERQGESELAGDVLDIAMAYRLGAFGACLGTRLRQKHEIYRDEFPVMLCGCVWRC